MDSFFTPYHAADKAGFQEGLPSQKVAVEVVAPVLGEPAAFPGAAGCSHGILANVGQWRVGTLTMLHLRSTSGIDRA